MGGWKLWFALLLLSASAVREERLLKIIGKGPDVIPVCSNKTLDIILSTICKITTERNGGEECRLSLRYGREIEQLCDSRISLLKQNQSLFLHLTSLTPVDSGNYTCECAHQGGTDTIHLGITVEGGEEASTSPFVATTVIGVTVLITGVLVGFILRRNHAGRNKPQPLSSLPRAEPLDIEPYSIFTQRENGLYSTAKVNCCQT